MPPPLFAAAGAIFGFPITIILRRNVYFIVSCSMEHNNQSGVKYDSLRVLEWDKLCQSVASFARTSLGRRATEAQLWSLDQRFAESLRLLQETDTAIRMLNYDLFNLDLTSVDLALVESAIKHARRRLPLDANEAVALLSLLQFVEALQLSLRAAIKQDSDWFKQFMPLSEMITQLFVNRSIIKLIQKVIDEDGSVKDSACCFLPVRLHQLMDNIIRNETKEASLMADSSVDGRWCIRSGADQPTNFKGLLLASGSGSIIEPFAAVPLNDELQQARALVAKAEADVLSMVTEKIQMDLDDTEKSLRTAIQLDMEIRRRKLQENMAVKGEAVIDISSLQKQVRALEEAPPVPVDFLISRKTRVLVITGPNTGGKTICLKTIGLADMMAKSGLHALSSESAKIPWFDSVFADIGDEQSLSQSFSTFSVHLKQISEIQSKSTSRSLVLLDEVGAGTNPLEGAALGMSLLESFAKSGALLTIASTHHGELKTFKYSIDAFENACVEFDEENLKPTYKILRGVPGLSNAINIAERLGVPGIIVDNARELYGAASAEIDEVIMDMETFKQKFQEHIKESRHYPMLSRDLHEKLLLNRRKLQDLGSQQRYKKMRELSEVAAVAQSTLHKKVQQLRTSAMKQSQLSKACKQAYSSK